MNFREIVGAEVCNQKAPPNSPMKLFWNFDNNLLRGRTSDQVEFWGKVIIMLAYPEGKGDRQSLCSLTSSLQFCKHYKLPQTSLWQRLIYSCTFFRILSAVLAQTLTAYISMYCNESTSFFTALRCFQFKKQEIRITHYAVSGLRQNCRAPLFMNTK